MRSITEQALAFMLAGCGEIYEKYSRVVKPQNEVETGKEPVKEEIV